MRGSKRRRHTSGSESEAGIEKQTSIVQRQASVIKSQGSKQFSEGGRSEELKKKQEEWDKEIPEVCRIFKTPNMYLPLVHVFFHIYMVCIEYKEINLVILTSQVTC